MVLHTMSILDLITHLLYFFVAFLSFIPFVVIPAWFLYLSPWTFLVQLSQFCSWLHYPPRVSVSVLPCPFGLSAFCPCGCLVSPFSCVKFILSFHSVVSPVFNQSLLLYLIVKFVNLPFSHLQWLVPEDIFSDQSH